MTYHHVFLQERKLSRETQGKRSLGLRLGTETRFNMEPLLFPACDSERERLHPISLLQFMALLVLVRVNSSYVKINLLHQEIVAFAFNYRKDTSHAE